MQRGGRVESLAAGEALAGTALAQTTHWLLVELSGPWAAKPIESAGFSPAVRDHIKAALAATPGSRLQLIRRPASSPGVTVKLVRSSPSGGMVHSLTLDSVDGLVDLDLPALWKMDASTDPAPFILVCAHGVRDQCCAREGAPVAHALCAIEPERVWQTSHLGGHRFAATAVVLPTGVQLGRLDPTESAAVWDAVHSGKIHSLQRYRGNTTWPKAAQAAAIEVRAAKGLMAVDALALQEVTLGEAGSTRVRLASPDGEVLVEVTPGEPGPPLRKSCAASELSYVAPLVCRILSP